MTKVHAKTAMAATMVIALCEKNGAKGGLVGTLQRDEPSLDAAADEVGMLVAEDVRGEARRECHRDTERDEHGDRHRDAELVEESTHHAFHEGDGNEHSHDARVTARTAIAIFARALSSGLEGRVALLHVADDVLDDHDGVVDEQAHGEGEGQHRDSC